MPVTQSTDISPQVLEAELRDLLAADWTSIWEGPPQPGTREFMMWREKHPTWEFGFEDRDLEVHTRNGVSFDLSANGLWRPVVAILLPLWRCSSGDPAEKDLVLHKGVSTWETYLDVVGGVVGAPDWAGSADDADFPDPPYEDLWRRPRGPDDNPQRLAYWRSETSGAGRPVLILRQDATRRTWEQGLGADSSVRLHVRPSAPNRRMSRKHAD